MGAAADLVAAGYGGYAGWGDTEAAADFNNTHGSGKQTSGGGGGGNGAPTFTAANLTDLENQVFQQLKPYYIQLLQEANGDFKVAQDKLVSDYVTNTRDAKILYTTGTTDELANLKNTLQTNDISNEQAQESAIDKLNARGAAVYQQGPGQALNVLGVHLPLGDSSPNAATDVNAGTAPLYSNPNNANLGEGGRELTQLQQDQQLRQEAMQRASNQKLEQLGLKYTAATQNPTGYDLSTPEGVKQAATDVNSGKVKLSDFGTEGQGAISNYNSAAQTNRQTSENLNQNLQQNVLQQGTSLAQAGAKTQDVQAQNTLNNQERQTFVNSGVT